MHYSVCLSFYLEPIPIILCLEGISGTLMACVKFNTTADDSASTEQYGRLTVMQ